MAGRVSSVRIGPHVVSPPVVLAPMAGITNPAFRTLCREQSAAQGGGGLFVGEMVTTRALVEQSRESWRLVMPGDGENPRSVQLYGVDPDTVGRAVRLLTGQEDRPRLVDHLDLNFGCPVPKVTRKGGGAALPWKTDRFQAVVRAAVRAAPCGVPVTVKMRTGLDDDHLTYLQAGSIAVAEGAAAVALHARTAAQSYSGHADWSAIARLRDALPAAVPVLGNGDIWSGEHALSMVAATGCDGVVVGRGCLGRPWLFADLAAGFAGRDDRARPTLREVGGTLRRHAVLLREFFGAQVPGLAPEAGRRPEPDPPSDAERTACRDLRKHVGWYLKGYRVGPELRTALALVESLAQLDDLLAMLDLDQGWPGAPAEGPRGRAGSARTLALPDGWLGSRLLDPASWVTLREAELAVSGG